MPEWMRPAVRYLLYALLATVVLDRAFALQNETRRILRERHRLRIKIARIRRHNTRQEQIKTALTSDPFYIERVLRERYGYRTPGEEQPLAPRRSTVAARQQPQVRLALPSERRGSDVLR